MYITLSRRIIEISETNIIITQHHLPMIVNEINTIKKVNNTRHHMNVSPVVQNATHTDEKVYDVIPLQSAVQTRTDDTETVQVLQDNIYNGDINQNESTSVSIGTLVDENSNTTEKVTVPTSVVVTDENSNTSEKETTPVTNDVANSNTSEKETTPVTNDESYNEEVKNNDDSCHQNVIDPMTGLDNELKDEIEELNISKTA